VIEDLNFDGYRDLRLIEVLPPGPNVPYLVWFFDPERRRFVATDIFAGIPNPKVDQAQRRIVSEWRDGPTRHGVSYYRYEDNRLVLVREKTEEYLGESRFRLLVRERRNGRMVDVRDEIVDIGPLDD
jgi:hypothetical protein